MLSTGSYALNSNKGTRERIGRLLLMHANSREDIDVARTGDIVAVAGLKNVITGETLCDEKHPVLLERMEVGVPGICQLPPWSPTKVVCCQKEPPQEGIPSAVPRPGHQDCDRAKEQGGPGEDEQWPHQAGAGGPQLPLLT